MSTSTHPLRERPDLPLEQRVEHYREQLAQLMDFVWWRVKLTDAEREAYRRQGFPDITLPEL
jgi:hypothetical protein